VQLGVDSTIRFGMRMEKIALNPDKTYTLAFDRGGGQRVDVATDIVCVALPFAMLRTLDYDGAGETRCFACIKAHLGGCRLSHI
jgi:hypothetical protein